MARKNSKTDSGAKQKCSYCTDINCITPRVSEYCTYILLVMEVGWRLWNNSERMSPMNIRI